MKIQIFIATIFFLNIYANAGTPFFPVGKTNAKTYYKDKAKCEAQEGQACYDITGKDLRFHSVQTGEVDDPSKPIYKTKYNVTACSNSQDCANKLSAEASPFCEEGDYPQIKENSLMPGYSYFCAGITGYEQIEAQVLVEDAALKAQILAADQAKKTLEEQIQARTKRINFGTRIVALMGVRNDSKSLTAEQSASFLQTYGPIMQMLQAGALDTAKTQIEGITPDGTVTTQADKDALLAEINSYLGL